MFDRRGRAARFVETGVTTAGGACLAAAVTSPIGLSIPAAVVGGINGAICGWRQTYEWSAWRGALAFGLDSTWALATTAASLGAHAIGYARGAPEYVVSLSRRQNRHVYRRGFQLRRGFLTTFGNVVTGAGNIDEARRRLIVHHEDVHIWQGRWFGPFFPVLYGGWLIIGGIVGATIWLFGRSDGRRSAGFIATVESCAYYLNPFERWAYSRDASWPPAGLVARWKSVRPLAQPFGHRRGLR